MNDLDKFFKNTNLSVVIDHAGRAGNGFFLAIFDQHPEVLTCPWMHYTYSYIITEFENSDKINSKIAHKFWTEQSYFRFIYNEPNEILSMQILKFGGNPDAEIDRAKVRKIFDDYVLNKEFISRKELVLITYYAYAVGTGRDISQVKYILVSDSISLRYENVQDGFSGRVIDEIIQDFNNPKIVHLVRDPRAGMASSRHQFINSLGNMYGIRIGNYFKRYFRLLKKEFDWDSVFVFGFWLMYFSRTYQAVEKKKSEHEKLFKTVRNEDLNLNFIDTMKNLTEWLGVRAYANWTSDNYIPTMAGCIWTGTGGYNNKYQTFKYGPLQNDSDEQSSKAVGPNAYVTMRWKKKLNKTDIILIESLLNNELVNYGYEFEFCKGKTGCVQGLKKELFKPLSGELPKLRWILNGRHLGILEFVNRLFYFFTFAPFYFTSRYILYSIIKTDKIFE